MIVELIRILHITLILFITCIPFMRNVHWPLLVLHSTSVFTLMAHWWSNQDACFLTLLECTMRGLPEQLCKSTSFMYQLVSPVYNIEDDQLKRFVMIVTPILGAISAYRIYKIWPLIKYELSVTFPSLVGY